MPHNTLRLFTSESVTEGHPDKICDAISDSILDAILAQDPTGRVAVETLVTTGQVHVVGEVRTTSYVDIATLVRQTLVDIGFVSSDVGFDGRTCGVNIAIGEQSAEIGDSVSVSQEVRDGHDTDADDQAGASCSATPPTKPPNTCRCRFRSPTGCPAGSPRSARKALSRTSAPTENAGHLGVR